MLVLKKIIISLASLFIIVLCIVIIWTIVSSVIQKKANEKIENLLDRLSRKTGIVVQYKGFAVNPFGEVTIQKISASFDSSGFPFLTLFGIKIKGKLGDWFSSFQVTRVEISGFTVRWSMDLLPAHSDYMKFLVSLFPGQDIGINETGKNKVQRSLIQLSDMIPVEIKNGRIFFTREIPDLYGGLPIVNRCRISILLNKKKLQVSGRCSGSGIYKTDNAACSFTISPFYQTMSVTLTEFSLPGDLPFVPRSIRLDSGSSFDALISIHKYHSDPNFHIDLKGYAKNITIDNSRVALQPLRNIQCAVRGRCKVDLIQKKFKADELLFFIGHAPFYMRDIEIRLPFDKPLVCKATFETEHLAVQDIIDSLPEGLIPHIKGARAEGYMNVSAFLVLDLENIDNTHLEIDGGISSFRVIHPPALCDVREISAMDYVHTVRITNQKHIAIEVGPANRHFVPLKNAGRFVIESVLTCEDGNFYIHNGFQLKHINGAIRQNLREKGFVRGASTVSMQLVKNLFLTHEKTISRKIEEVMLTWWMEQEIEKKRMLEVYLNIIEWGPGIFGIGSASEHYFHCTPKKLSCLQATWLASIIKNPSLFYHMKTERKIDEDMRACIRFVMKAMKKQGGISDRVLIDAEKKNYEVYFPETEREKIGVVDSGNGENVVVSQ